MSLAKLQPGIRILQLIDRTAQLDGMLLHPVVQLLLQVHQPVLHRSMLPIHLLHVHAELGMGGRHLIAMLGMGCLQGVQLFDVLIC